MEEDQLPERAREEEGVVVGEEVEGVDGKEGAEAVAVVIVATAIALILFCSPRLAPGHVLIPVPRGSVL